MLGFKWCVDNGYTIKAVVADGLKGLAKTLLPIPFGICQVHIQSTIQTKLTKKPKSIASKELLELSKKANHTKQRKFYTRARSLPRKAQRLFK